MGGILSFLLCLLISFSIVVFAEDKVHPVVERFKNNETLCKEYGSDLNKREIFDPLLDYVNDSSPWWTYEKIIAGIKEKKLIGKSKLTKVIVGNPSDFIVYYDKGGLRAKATLYPLEQNIKDSQVRSFLFNEIKARIDMEITDLCSVELEEYCEGFMGCEGIHKYFIIMSKKFDGYPEQKKLLSNYYKNEASKSFDKYAEKIWGYLKKEQPYPWKALTRKDVDNYIKECKERVR